MGGVVWAGHGRRATTMSTALYPDPPFISMQPGIETISNGQIATLTAMVGGTGPLTYQWFQGRTGDRSTPVGTNSDSYTTPSLVATTYHWVSVINAQGSVDSDTVTVSPGESRFSLRDRGGLSMVSPGGSVSTVTGYVRIQPDSGSTVPSGMAIFGSRQNGILVSEAGVPASPLVTSGRIAAVVCRSM